MKGKHFEKFVLPDYSQTVAEFSKRLNKKYSVDQQRILPKWLVKKKTFEYLRDCLKSSEIYSEYEIDLIVESEMKKYDL